ncbi:MAG: hypothetical protein AAF211_29555, partial [Myxococcota bacterium]
GTSLLLRGERAEAGDVLSDALDAAYGARRPIPVTVGYILARQAQWALASGDAASAAQLAAESHSCIAHLNAQAAGRAEGLRAVALAHLGEHAEARRLAERAEAVERERGSSVRLATVLARRGVVAWLAGEADRAIEVLDEAEAALRRTQTGPLGIAGVAVAELRRYASSQG